MKHLKDGYIISIGRKKSTLVNLETREEQELAFRDIQSIQALALGKLGTDNDLLMRLDEQGLLVEGPITTDEVMKEKLSELDALFLQSYAPHLSPREKQAHELILVAHARRKQFYSMVGQCPVLPETALRRALHVGDAQNVGKKKIICVGDDDLVSVGLAALGHEVISCDIDDYLLAFLDDVAKEFKLDLTTLELDLRDPVPSNMIEAFDVFLTDPMSNRECFELFLSRALAMLKPDGQGFTAVHGPTTKLFEDLAAEMNLDIIQWHRRHNRYYSHFMKHHRYESDWLELAKREDTRLPHGVEEFASPLQLYREDYYQRPVTLLEFYDDIEDDKYAKPLYLDILLDAMLLVTETEEIERHWHYAQEWTAVHIHTTQGYIALHVHRKNRQIILNNYPFFPEIEEGMRYLLLNAYKRAPKEAYSATNYEFWDLRLR